MSLTALSSRVHSLASSKPIRSRFSRARTVKTCASSRPMWYPGAVAPPHLDGSMVGDYGFDPLRLGTDPETVKWYREGELYNGRWAMAAVVGILFTDAIGLPKWWEAGAQEYPIGTVPLAIIEAVVFAVLEGKRYEGYKKTGECGVLGFFPFDPLGLKSESMKLKELKNGRLAMLAMLGFASQAAVRGKGPIECLQDHLADPAHNNIFTSKVGNECVVAVIALSIWPMVIELSKYVGKPSEPLFPWKENA